MSNETANPLRVALFFGGVSSEHEISCISAAAWAGALNEPPCREKYQVVRVGITKDGRWLRYDGGTAAMADGSWQNDPACRPCILSPDRSVHGLMEQQPDGSWQTLPVDVAVPMLHGKNGEDGTIQGLFEIAGIPYVGCGVLGSAVCMDKAVANTLMDASGVPHCRWTWAAAEEAADFDALADRVESRLVYPIFVKPANAGSSVGISKAHTRTELRAAVDVALAEDAKVIFEEFIDGQEVECAAIGNPETGVSVTRPGEILAGAEFYTYDDKYKNGVSQVVIPAHLSDEKLDEVRDAAKAAYLALGLHRPGPLRLFCGARHRPGAVQRAEHHAGLYRHQHVSQADGSLPGAELFRPGGQTDRPCPGQEKGSLLIWIPVPSACLTAAWAA